MPLPTKRIAQRFAQLPSDHVCVCLLSQPTGKHVKVHVNQILSKTFEFLVVILKLLPGFGDFLSRWTLTACQRYVDQALNRGNNYQGSSPRGICLSSRRPRGASFNWLGLASASHGLASVSTLLPRPRLCLIVLVLAWSGI